LNRHTMGYPQDLRSQEGGWFIQYWHFSDKSGDGEILQMRTSALLVQKTSDFSNFIVCPHKQWRGVGGWGMSHCGTFFGQQGVNFLRFCADVLYGRPLL